MRTVRDSYTGCHVKTFHSLDNTANFYFTFFSDGAYFIWFFNINI
jgi:hypothetical protein